MRIGAFALAVLACIAQVQALHHGGYRGRGGSTASLTYTKDIAPLMADRCEMCHHEGGSAPFALGTYAEVKRRAALIASVTKSRYMPPWKADPSDGPFVGQHPLSEQEIALVQQWATEGTPEGDPRDLPRPRQWTAGWQLGTPDLVVTLSEPYMLQAAGTDVFRIFVLPVARAARPASSAASSSVRATRGSCTTPTSASTPRARRARSTKRTRVPGTPA